MFLKHTKFTALALAFILLSPSISDAKGGRGGGSFSSSRSSSSYSKPPSSLPGASRPATVHTGGSQNRNLQQNSPNSYTKPSAPQSSNGYTKPGATNNPTITPTMKPNAVGALGSAANATMSRDSLNSYMAERNKFTRPPTAFNKDAVKTDPAVQTARRQYPKMDDYMQSRTRELQNYNSRFPETQRYNRNMSPNYGMFDSNFLIGMLLGHWTGSSSNSNSNSNAAWFNSQKDQEWYKQWRSDADKTAQENPELKARLDQLDRDIEAAKHTPMPAASALPEGVPSALAVAPEAVLVDAYENHSFPWGWTLFMLFLGIVALMVFYFHQTGAKPRRRYA